MNRENLEMHLDCIKKWKLNEALPKARANAHYTHQGISLSGKPRLMLMLKMKFNEEEVDVVV